MANIQKCITLLTTNDSQDHLTAIGELTKISRAVYAECNVTFFRGNFVNIDKAILLEIFVEELHWTFGRGGSSHICIGRSLPIPTSLLV